MKVGWVRTDGRDGVMIVPQAALDVFEERRRQVYEEVWTPEHDDRHDQGEMAKAGACYAIMGYGFSPYGSMVRRLWPWSEEWLKLASPRRMLVKAAALLIAEIERIDRAEDRQHDRAVSHARKMAEQEARDQESRK